MLGPIHPRLEKWPFLLADAFLLSFAGFVYSQSNLPMAVSNLVLAAGCVVCGGLFAITPFLLEYQADLRSTGDRTLADNLGRLQKLEQIAAQIGSATLQWQVVQDAAAKVSAEARATAERMSSEARAFKEFLERTNDSERATLRLEAQKLRRAENDWIQVTVRILDHVYALRQGALRSGLPNVIEQINQFEKACRDAARRVGLLPLVAEPSQPFDPQQHQLFESDAGPPHGALIAETVACGYTFQGRILRPALVRVCVDASRERSADSAQEADPSQSQLPLESGTRISHR